MASPPAHIFDVNSKFSGFVQPLPVSISLHHLPKQTKAVSLEKANYFDVLVSPFQRLPNFEKSIRSVGLCAGANFIVIAAINDLVNGTENRTFLCHHHFFRE